MEYLNALDAAFLEIEDADPRVSLSIGSVTVIDGPVPDRTELLDVLGARLPQHSIITLTTNVAGPEKPLRVLGRRIVYDCQTSDRCR